jgi:hypothetical protein
MAPARLFFRVCRESAAIAFAIVPVVGPAVAPGAPVQND